MATSKSKGFSGNVKDITGQRFGWMTVLAFSHTDKYGAAMWLCRCDCGAKKIAKGIELRKGQTKSCGCYNLKSKKTHGGWSNPLYYIWHGMWKRCTNPQAHHADRYMGRGISVCERWRDPVTFYADMGPRPSPAHTLDRIDNDGNYEPSNCRWATSSEQMRNTSRTRVITYKGRTLHLVEWARITGIGKEVLRSRLDYGWPVDRALTEPVRRKRA